MGQCGPDGIALHVKTEFPLLGDIKAYDQLCGGNAGGALRGKISSISETSVNLQPIRPYAGTAEKKSVRGELSNLQIFALPAAASTHPTWHLPAMPVTRSVLVSSPKRRKATDRRGP